MQQADLVIIGGGYMAINALEAAAYHLPKGAKVTRPLQLVPLRHCPTYSSSDSTPPPIPEEGGNGAYTRLDQQCLPYAIILRA